MKEKKKSPAEARLTKKGQLLIDSAKRISESSDPVNIVASLIEYHRLSAKMYRENQRRR